MKGWLKKQMFTEGLAFLLPPSLDTCGLPLLWAVKQGNMVQLVLVDLFSSLGKFWFCNVYICSSCISLYHTVCNSTSQKVRHKLLGFFVKFDSVDFINESFFGPIYLLFYFVCYFRKLYTEVKNKKTKILCPSEREARSINQLPFPPEKLHVLKTDIN